MNSRIANIIAGIILLAGIGVYLFKFFDQVHGVQQLCPKYKVGASILGIENEAKNYSVKLRGPTKLSSGESVYHVCAEFTLCDISCDLYFTDSVVTSIGCENCGI